MSHTYRTLPGVGSDTTKRKRCWRKPSQTLWYARLLDRCCADEYPISKLNRINHQTNFRPDYYEDTPIAALEELPQKAQNLWFGW